jgi:hydroxymethylbilane synthase
VRLRIATRRSALALAQTRMVARAIAAHAPGLEVVEVPIVTEGDRVQDRSLSAVGGKGLFVKDLEAALLDGRADLAVHSMKDVPAALAPGLGIACVPARESPWDLLVAREPVALDALPRGARVGTSSLRRALQLAAVRPDLVVEPLRGNVDTRLRKLSEGHYHAVVLAEAGVRRLGLEVRGVRLEAMVPAIGQGALALEARADDRDVSALVAPLNDADAHLATRAERAVLRAVGGDCTVPVGAHARRVDDRLAMAGFYAAPAGKGHRTARAECTGAASDPEGVGRELATRLLAAVG